MADSLHLCFPLGRFGRLPLVVCRFLLPWSQFAETRIVLDNVSWQFGPSLFDLRHFFLLGMGLGLDMEWAEVAKFFGPTIYIYIYIYISFHYFLTLFDEFSSICEISYKFLVIYFIFPKIDLLRDIPIWDSIYFSILFTFFLIDFS